MFQTLFALTPGFLYLGNILRGLVHGVLALRNLHIIPTHLIPTLPSPQPTLLLEAPIAPLELLEEFRTPSPSGGLIVIEGPPLVLPSTIPTHSYQSSLVTVTPNRLPDLVPLLLLLAFISGFVLLLPGLVYVFATIANRISAFSRQSRKFSKAYSFKPIFSLGPVFNLVPHYFPTQIFSRHLFVSLASLLLLWTGPPAIASFFTLICIIFKLPLYQQFSNMIVCLLQRCGLLTPQDTQTPPVLNVIYEQIVNKTVTYNKLFWHKNPPSESKQEPTRAFAGVGATRPHLEVRPQYHEQDLLDSLTQHKLELEEEKQHRLRAQRVYSVVLDSQNSLRRQLEVSRTREEKLKADLLAAEAERKELKDLIATLEASDVALRADLSAAVIGTCEVEMMFDHQSRLVAEKDHVIRSTTNDLLAVRAVLQDAEDKIARLDAELQSERDLRILRTKELLDEQAKTRGRHEAEMRRIATKAEAVQEQLDLLDGVLSQSRARTQSLPDDAHTPRPRTYAIVIPPDDTGQPPPPPLEPIPDAQTLFLEPITKPRSPLSPKLLRPPPERNLHEPPIRHPPDHPRQISACLDRVSDTAESWRAWVESLLETINRLEEERTRQAEDRAWEAKDRAREAESHERSEWCLQEELAVTKGQLRATQEEVSSARHEVDLGREALRDVRRELETCQVRLKDVQDARRAGINKFCDAVEMLRLRSADLESLKAEAEASRSKHSQAMSLSAVLRKRVTILEAEVKSLNRDQRCSETPPEHANSFCPTNTDPIPTTHSAGIQTQDSLYMKLSSSLHSLLDSSLPPLPLPSNNLLPSLSKDQMHTITGLDDVSLNLDPPQRPDLSSIRHPSPPFLPEILSSPSRTRRHSEVFLPVGSSVDSMDWPPIGSMLQPSGKNAEQDGGVSVRKTPQSPRQEADHIPSTSTTSFNPFNSYLTQVLNSRPLVFGDPGRQFGLHGSASFRSINATGIEAPPSLAPASPPHIALTSPSREVSTSPALSSPAQPPSPRSSGPAQLSQFTHTRPSLFRPLHAEPKEDNLGMLERLDLSDWGLPTSAHNGDALTLVRHQTVVSTQARLASDGGDIRHERATAISAAAAAANTCVSPQDGRLSVLARRMLLRPFGSNDAGGTMRITAPDRLGVRQSPLSSSEAFARLGLAPQLSRLPPSSRLRPEAVPESGYHRNALSSHTPPGSPPPCLPPTAQPNNLSDPIHVIPGPSSRLAQPRAARHHRAPSEPIPGGGVDAHAALKRSTRSTPQSPLPRLLPGLLDPFLLRERELRYDDSPCAFGKRKFARRPKRHRPHARPYIPTLDYGLPKNFIPDAGCVATKRPDQGLDDDFAYLIPLDCLTSTPVAISKRLASKWHSPESESKQMSPVDKRPQPGAAGSLSAPVTPWRGKENALEHRLYPPDPIFDFFGI